MLPRAVLRRVFIMSTHFAIAEDSHVILVAETVRLPQAYELVRVLPCDEVVRIPLAHEIFHELSRGARFVDRTDQEVLPFIVAEDARASGEVAHIRMEGRIETPYPVPYLLKKSVGIGHPGIRKS